MQQKHKSKIYLKLLVGSIAVTVIGFIVTIAGLNKVYDSVNKSGFSDSNASGPVLHTGTPKVASIVAQTGFYFSLLFLILFLVARRKEKK